MKFADIEKLTLIDYPGKIAATLFVSGCNFRCPFCHNPELVLNEKKNMISEEEAFDFLEKRKGKLEGVCITGGEPTLQKGLPDFMKKVKNLGFLVKLDTNGFLPEVLEQILKNKLVDFVAMDIKNSKDGYGKACGLGEKIDIEKIEKSVDLIRQSGVDYEFRTTVVPLIHTKEDFDRIGKWLSGSKKYALQKFENKGKILDEKLKDGLDKIGVALVLEDIKKKLENCFEKVEIR